MKSRIFSRELGWSLAMMSDAMWALLHNVHLHYLLSE